MAIADFLLKIGSTRLSVSLGLVTYGGSAFFIGLGWLAWQKLNGESHLAEPLGVAAGISVGILFSCVTVCMYSAFNAHAPISLLSPSIRLGGLLLASLMGFALLQEPLTLRYLAGVLLASGGVYLIMTR